MSIYTCSEFIWKNPIANYMYITELRKAEMKNMFRLYIIGW